MTRLERLGLEVVAYTLLGNRGKAALLMALIDGSGVAVSAETLAAARAWKMPEIPFSLNAVRTRICWLREALSDIGFPGVIKHVSGFGYALPEPGRSAIIARLEAEAA